MTILDNNGRLFGRINLVDGMAMLFLLGLVPVAYASYLLFKTPVPRIESVTQVEVTGEERRIAAGNELTAKLKIRGSGLNPLLRARIGDHPALGFVFENPNSADVLVGRIPAGVHDFVLMDGVNEVARAEKVVEISAERAARVRVVGRLVSMPRALAEGLSVSNELQSGSRIVALGPIEPARLRVALGDRSVDLPIQDFFERGAVLDLACDPGLRDEPCAIAGRYLNAERPVMVLVPPGLVLAADEVLPPTAATRAEISVRLTGGGELDSVKVGDRDALLDERAATIRSVGPRTTRAGFDSMTIVLTGGIDEAAGGWTYRGRPVRPGERFTFDTGRYLVHGTIEVLKVLAAAPPS